MKKVHFLFISFAVAAFAACTGCEDHPTPPQPPVSNGLSIDGIKLTGEVEFDSMMYKRINEEQFHNLNADLDSFYMHLNSFDFDKHLSFMYEGMWLNDSIRGLTMNQMETYHEKGYYNLVDSMKIDYVGPLVLDSATQELITLVEAYTWSRIVIEEKYGLDDPVPTMQGMLNTRYGQENYYYDADSRSIYIQAPSKMYIFLDTETNHFQFLSELYLESPMLGALLEYNTVRTLKKMDSMRP